MQRTWKPTILGKVFTLSSSWTLSLDSAKFNLLSGDTAHKGDTLALEKLSVTPGIFWSTITLPLDGGKSISLGGLSNSAADEVARTVAQAARSIRVNGYIKSFGGLVKLAVQWASLVDDACREQIRTKGWLTHEFKIAQNRIKPYGLETILNVPEVRKHLEAQPQNVQKSVSLWQRNFDEVADEINQQHLENELHNSREFFDKVEKSPLTDEQARAVVCFDNRVLLVASAGSGKTSTMVAKAGYALKKGYFTADKVLLLAFNKDAASELRERIRLRLEPLGLPADKIVAKTFHAFGLDVIGQATGKRPSLASWVESGKDLEVLLELVDKLKDQDLLFRTNWDLFRIVLGQDLPKFGKEQEAPDSWDREQQKEGFWTLNGEVVKSRGEQVIANWLFYNGVEYQYEEPYRIDTADAQHRQYCPDFYFPTVDAYLEHWAVDQNGNPPAEFVGYKEGMEWKRLLHAAHNTKLLETSMADLWSGRAFEYLTQELAALGITLDPDPERPAKGRKPIENPRLARTFRTFLTHAKSNRLSVEEIRTRLGEGVAGLFNFRHRIFLYLFEQLWAAWEERLNSERCIDFEDMLKLAADCIEEGRIQLPYELVMVDEFQDVSQARARLVSSMLTEPGKYLFAVGDDWQSINRFAGSDLGVMTDFEAVFGKAVSLKLETTFRCPQSLCDISSSFVQKNPKQIQKKVRSVKPDISNPVRIMVVDDDRKIRTAVTKRIQEISNEWGGANIFILGRYNRDREYLPLINDPNIRVEFVTVHASKGLEADHIIIPKVTAETLGFPSRVEDDPVLQLAMPSGDYFTDAEERRLFYVALTRARGTVTLISISHKESPFIVELVRDHKLVVSTLEGKEMASQVCPKCKEGFLVEKTGKYGSFIGCSRYPRCRHTEKIENFQKERRV